MMLRTTAHQGAVFLAMAAAGALSALWYDFLRAVCRRLEGGFWLSLGADLFFGAGAAVLYIVFSLRAGFGQIRLYQLIAFALGAAVYMSGPHILLLQIAGRLCARLRRITPPEFLKKIFR